MSNEDLSDESPMDKYWEEYFSRPDRDFLHEARKDRTPEELKILNMNRKEAYDYINPNHYKQSSKEVIEMMEDVWGTEKLIAHCEMCAFKYRMRLGSKPEQPVERDLEKAKWYEAKALELKNK